MSRSPDGEAGGSYVSSNATTRASAARGYNNPNGSEEASEHSDTKLELGLDQ